MRLLLLRLCCFFWILGCCSLALAEQSELAPVEILFWHSMAGRLGEELNQLTDSFNQSQKQYRVKAVYKGDYSDCLTSYSAAFRAGQAPALVQIYEVGTESMLRPKGITKPVELLMQQQGRQLPLRDFLPALRQYYSRHGQLMAMPFNISVPIVYYNQAALSALKPAVQSLPTTWEGLERLAKRFKEAGYRCAYTTAYPSWFFIESFSALHHLPLFDARKERALYNSPAQQQFLERIARLSKLGYFEYAGRTNDGNYLFSSGSCPIFTQSSGSYTALQTLSPFQLAIAALPMEHRLSKQRYNNIVGGAALWVTAGLGQAQETGIAAFFEYWLKPEVQRRWHQQTGYLPLGLGGVYQPLMKESNPILQIAKADWAGQHDRGEEQGMQNQIRQINDAEIEAILAGLKSPAQALQDAVLRANYALRRFKQNS